MNLTRNGRRPTTTSLWLFLPFILCFCGCASSPAIRGDQQAAEGADGNEEGVPEPVLWRPEPERVAAETRRHFEEGIRYMGADQLADAEEHFEAAARLSPTWDLAQLKLAEVRRMMGMGHEEILPYLEGAVQAGTSNPQVFYHLGLGYEDAGREDEAVEAYQMALGIRDDIVHAQIRLAILLRSRDRLQEAQAALERALRYEPNHVVANTHLASIYEELGKLDQAEERLRSLCRLDARSPFPWANLAEFFRRHGRDKEAREAEVAAERRRERMLGPKRQMRQLPN